MLTAVWTAAEELAMSRAKRTSAFDTNRLSQSATPRWIGAPARAVLVALCTTLWSWAGCARTGSAEGDQAQAALELLNVSYDPTREFYQEVNPLFAQHWAKETGAQANIKMSHGGAGKQARAVMDGLEADVVTLALEYDINAIARKGLTDTGWRKRLPSDSAPYTSTIVFLVRQGNPKGIKDWRDLIKGDVAVITPNPKTSGGARWNYLAAWAFAKRRGDSDEQAEAFLREVFKRVPVLDSGARGSTNTFAERGIGDVLLTWENEGLLAVRELGVGKFEVVYPSVSILAEPPVAVIDSHCTKHKTCAAAEAYLRFLYTEEAQDLAGKHGFRPRSASALAKYADKFPKIELVTIDELAGGWDVAQPRFFGDGGQFDAIYAAPAGQ
jgi:sulfate/thiosulfate-binding protein